MILYKKNFFMLCCFFFYFQKSLLFGQDFSSSPFSSSPSANADAVAKSADEKVFVIRDITFDVTGRSQPFALMYHGDFKIGETIEGEEALEKYIKAKTQLLINQRVLATAEIQYTRGEPEARGGPIPIDLFVTVADTWNIIALPYPKVDSNSGFEIIIKARDYNFLGTMSPLRIDLGYEHREADDQTTPVKDVFKFEIDSDTPFRAFGLKWNLDFDHTFAYTLIDEEGSFSYKNITGLSVEIPLLQRTVLTVGFEQNFIVHEENPDRYVDEYGMYADFYMANGVYTSWKIPLGVSIYDFGELTYTPRLSGQINYRPDGELEFWRKGPSITFSHSLGFGQIDWIGNFRKGLEGSFSNSNTFNTYSQGWSNSYTVSLVAHKLFTEFFGISTLFQVRQWFFYDPDTVDEGYPPYTETGGAIRGVLNKHLKAYDKDYMISLNLDFTFRVLRFLPSQWFHTKKLRFFDFDMHLAPFVDMAIMQGGMKGAPGDDGGGVPSWGDKIPMPQGLVFAAGLEVIVFPAFMRSLYLRVSLGYNLNKLAETLDIPKWDELFIGIGHHY